MSTNLGAVHISHGFYYDIKQPFQLAGFVRNRKGFPPKISPENEERFFHASCSRILTWQSTRTPSLPGNTPVAEKAELFQRAALLPYSSVPVWDLHPASCAVYLTPQNCKTRLNRPYYIRPFIESQYLLTQNFSRFTEYTVKL